MALRKFFGFTLKIERKITKSNGCFSYSLGGSGPVIWSYFAEFQPKSRRGSMLSFMAAFWTIGNLFVAGMAWIIIPSGELRLNMGKFPFGIITLNISFQTLAL